MDDVHIKRRRQSVDWFANDMEKRLQANDGKGRYGWAGWDKCRLLKMLMVETIELAAAIAKGDDQAIRDESCDVGNFAMMIHDHRSVTASRSPNEDKR